jgi:hypothetical protein
MELSAVSYQQSANPFFLLTAHIQKGRFMDENEIGTGYPSSGAAEQR